MVLKVAVTFLVLLDIQCGWSFIDNDSDPAQVLANDVPSLVVRANSVDPNISLIHQTAMERNYLLLKSKTSLPSDDSRVLSDVNDITDNESGLRVLTMTDNRILGQVNTTTKPFASLTADRKHNNSSITQRTSSGFFKNSPPRPGDDIGTTEINMSSLKAVSTSSIDVIDVASPKETSMSSLDSTDMSSVEVIDMDSLKETNMSSLDSTDTSLVEVIDMDSLKETNMSSLGSTNMSNLQIINTSPVETTVSKTTKKWSNKSSVENDNESDDELPPKTPLFSPALIFILATASLVLLEAVLMYAVNWWKDEERETRLSQLNIFKFFRRNPTDKSPLDDTTVLIPDV